MRTRIVDDELRIHLDMVETRELEETGYTICVDQEDDDIEVCVTCLNDELYDVWTKADGLKYTSYSLKLSYTTEQENEEI